MVVPGSGCIEDIIELVGNKKREACAKLEPFF
jgi:hypothetical protein